MNRFALLLAVIGLTTGCATSGSQKAQSKEPSAELILTVKAFNTGSLTPFIETRRVGIKSSMNAFDAMRLSVPTDFQTYSELGSFVTGISGVQVTQGHYWMLYVDGKPAQKGIGNIKLDADTLLEWRLEPDTPEEKKLKAEREKLKPMQESSGK